MSRQVEGPATVRVSLSSPKHTENTSISLENQFSKKESELEKISSHQIPRNVSFSFFLIYLFIHLFISQIQLTAIILIPSHQIPQWMPNMK